eukprot:SAG31_NODE_14960_length_778_cov_1.134021_1_plen_56_part_10
MFITQSEHFAPHNVIHARTLDPGGGMVSTAQCQLHMKFAASIVLCIALSLPLLSTN